MKLLNNFLIIGILNLGLNACKSSETNQEVNANVYPIVYPRVIDTTYTEEYVAEIHAVQNVEIRTRIKGFIERILVDEGKFVQKGQTLFVLSNNHYKEDLLRARAQYKSTIAELKSVEVELKNTQVLVSKNIVSSSELAMVNAKKEAIEAKQEEAQAAISVAKLNLEFTEIKAPFSGVINRIPYKPGSLIEEGTLLTSLSNIDEMLVYFHLSESEYLNYKSAKEQQSSSKVKLKLANNEPYRFDGVIEISESEFDPESGNIAFRARFPNPERLLKHGGHGKVLVEKRINNAMIIPQRSTFEIQDKLFVFVVGADGKVQQKAITPVRRIPNYFVIERDLSESTALIFEGASDLKHGDKVKTKVANQVEEPSPEKNEKTEIPEKKENSGKKPTAVLVPNRTHFSNSILKG